MLDIPWWCNGGWWFHMEQRRCRVVGRGGEASLTRIEAGTVRVRACVAVTVAVRVIVTVAVVGKRLSARLSVGRGGGMRGCGV